MTIRKHSGSQTDTKVIRTLCLGIHGAQGKQHSPCREIVTSVHEPGTNRKPRHKTEWWTARNGTQDKEQQTVYKQSRGQNQTALKPAAKTKLKSSSPLGTQEAEAEWDAGGGGQLALLRGHRPTCAVLRVCLKTPTETKSISVINIFHEGGNVASVNLKQSDTG